jgi:hypothetical protein
MSGVKLCIYWLDKLLFHERNPRLYVTFLILRLVNTTDSCTCFGAWDNNDGTTTEGRTGNDVNGRNEDRGDSCQSYFIISYFTSQGLFIFMFSSEIWNSYSCVRTVVKVHFDRKVCLGSAEHKPVQNKQKSRNHIATS